MKDNFDLRQYLAEGRLLKEAKDTSDLDWQAWIKRDEQARREWMEERLSETVDEVFAS